MIRKSLAEFIGTFALVFCGTGAIIIDQATGGVITHPGIAATFGLVILAMIYCFGEVSGAHFNPAVTIAFASAKLFPRQMILPYLLSQVAGALFASFLLHLLFPANASLGTTEPTGTVMQTIVLEIILTFLLMTVIFNVSQGSKEVGVMAGIAIGATIMLEGLFAGPVTGASMNPARSFGPAVISMNLSSLWMYILGPVAGSLLASFVYTAMRVKK